MTRASVVMLWVALAAGGCKKDACLDAEPQAQIDVELSPLASLGVSNVDVTLTINNGAPSTRRFDAEPVMKRLVQTISFVYAFGAQPSAPRSLVIEATAYNNASQKVGSGRTNVPSFTPDACNFFTVTMQPSKPSDAGPDGPRLEGPKPEAGAVCGDNVISPGEQCDGAALGGKSCTDLDLQGQLTCVACSFAGCTTEGYAQLKAGAFTMGSGSQELCRSKDDDEDRHQVTLKHDFEIKITEATQGVFQAVMGYNNSAFKSCDVDATKCPVESVTWHEAVAFCNKLSGLKGLTPCYTCTGTEANTSCEEKEAYAGAKLYSCPGYRLPTEAEWEYAYRAGTTTAYYNGDLDVDPTLCDCSPKASAIGWYGCTASTTTKPVAKLEANAWGLYDMAGNVLEWCEDWYTKSLGTTAVTDPSGPVSGGNRVARGGYWGYPGANLRAAFRDDALPTRRLTEVGFRCARTLLKAP